MSSIIMLILNLTHKKERTALFVDCRKRQIMRNPLENLEILLIESEYTKFCRRLDDNHLTLF